MDFLLSNACWLSEGKRLLVCTSCSLLTTTRYFVQGLGFFVDLRLSSLLCLLSLLPFVWSPVHSPLLIFLFLIGKKHSSSHMEADSVKPMWHASFLSSIPIAASKVR